MITAPASPFTRSDVAALSRRIASLRADIAAAREKERRLRNSIQTRQITLNRLQTQLARYGESGAALLGHVH